MGLPVIRAGAFAVALLWAVPALSADYIQQSGSVTQGHVASWVGSGLQQDAGPATGGRITELGITKNGGLPLCINTALVGLPLAEACQGVSSTTGAFFSLQSYNGQAAMPLSFLINGFTPLVLNADGTITTNITGSTQCLQVSTVGLVSGSGGTCGGGGGTPGGSSGQVQYNNSGSFGGFTVSGDGTLDTGTGALTVSSAFGGVPFATSAFVDTTNASNISSGTLIPSAVTGTGTLTVGATGAGFTIDFGASTVSGQLGLSGGGTGASISATSGGIPYFSSTSAMGSSGLLTHYGLIYGGGAGAAPVSMVACSSGAPVLGGSTAPVCGSDVNLAYTDVAQAFTKSQRGTPVNIAISTATFTPSFNNAQNFEIDLTSACPCALANPSTSLVAGQSGMFEIHQDGSGSRTIVTWGSDYQSVGGTSTIVLSTAASAIDYLPYYVNNAATAIVFGGLIRSPSH